MTIYMDEKTPFPYKTVPYGHQVTDFERSKDLEYFACLWEMGAGKTKHILDVSAYLYLKGKINGLLVCAPKGAYMNWENYEVPAHLTDAVDYRIAHYDAGGKTREKRLAMQLVNKPDPEALDILLINTEALSSKAGADIAATFLRSHKCLMCVDESSDIKNPKAARTKNALKLGKLAKYRRILTGTPITQSPLDLFGQCNFLAPKLLGHTSWFAFKNYYANIVQMRMGTRTFPKIVGFRNMDELQERLRKFSSRILKKDCLDLPEKIFVTRSVELTPEQREAYDSLRLTCIAEFKTGLVTVQNAITLLGKLQQVVCGHCKDEDGRTHRLPSNRIDELMRVTTETDDKIIIWCNFREDVHILEYALEQEYGADSTVTYYGDTKQDERAVAIDRFSNDPTCRFFISTSAGSKGITLNSSHTVIYYSHSFSLMTYLQSQDRNHRPGQRHDVTYISLVAENTTDAKIVKALADKIDVATSILDQWTEILDVLPGM